MIASYSEATIINCEIFENHGSIIKAMERSNFKIFKTFFQNNHLQGKFTIFSISLLTNGSINECFFINQTGESDGYLLTMLNTIIELNLDVIF